MAADDAHFSTFRVGRFAVPMGTAGRLPSVEAWRRIHVQLLLSARPQLNPVGARLGAGW